MATLSESIIINTPTTSHLLAKDDDSTSHCQEEPLGNYSTILGVTDMPQWEALLTIVTLSLLILLTIIGNILVILGVFTHKPLRIVQNFFIVSLAVADLTVAVLVLPLNVIYSVLGRWEFGIEICKMWLTSDVLCCTASILNLCAIALDRFWAITDPINYAQKRTVKRVLAMIAGVWILSLVISSPPLIGWNDWDLDKFEVKKECALTKRKGYVVYSSLGSFYIPLFIMTLVYIEIFIATKRRLRERAQASKINAISLNANKQAKNEVDNENESVSSETNHNEHPEIVVEPVSTNSGAKRKKKRRKRHFDKPVEDENQLTLTVAVNDDSLTEDAENSSISQHQRKNSLPSTSDLTSVVNKVTARVTPPKKVTVEHKKSGLVYQFIEEKQRISLSKERRAARTLGIIMGVFVVCWLPFFLMYVITPFCDTCCPSRRLINFITWLGYINSVLNPIIYTIFNMDFRRAFRKLLGLKI